MCTSTTLTSAPMATLSRVAADGGHRQGEQHGRAGFAAAWRGLSSRSGRPAYTRTRSGGTVTVTGPGGAGAGPSTMSTARRPPARSAGSRRRETGFPRACPPARAPRPPRRRGRDRTSAGTTTTARARGRRRAGAGRRGAARPARRAPPAGCPRPGSRRRTRSRARDRPPPACPPARPRRAFISTTLIRDGEGLLLIVGDVDGGDAHAPLQAAHLHPQALADLGVEIRQRLVQQEHARLHHEARASATRCCWPPDSAAGLRRAIASTSPISTSASASRTRRVISAAGTRRSRRP